MVYFKNAEDLKIFSTKIKEECFSEGTYSVYDAAEKIGASEEQIHEWALHNPDTLKHCRIVCFSNTKEDFSKAKLSQEKAFLYMNENNAEFKKYSKILTQNDEEKEEALKELIFLMVLP